MGDAGGTQQSRSATALQDASSTQTPKDRGHKPNSEDKTAEWYKIIGQLTELGSDLAKPNGAPPRAKLQEVVQNALRMLRVCGPPATQTENNLEAKLNSLEGKIDAIAANVKSQRGQTWASVAAAPAPRTLPTAQRTAVRVRIADAKGKTPAEILAAIKPTIQGAYAVRPLKSGDIDIMVPDQKAKDQALNQQDGEGYKILRQDYPVEIPGVPLSIGIKEGKGADNTELIRNICNATKKTIPTITINKIRWLLDDKARSERMQNGKTRSTAVISLPTQALQHEVVRRGIVIESQIYDARIYNNGIQVKQCFNCQQWGHTQSACGKQARCGECAGPHQTKECTKERVSCTNCGREHRAWQKRECRTFQKYREEINSKRVELFAATARIRSADVSHATLRADGFELVGARKRGRALSPTPKQPIAKRGPGRPSLIETAARDPSQTRIQINGTQRDGLGENSMQDSSGGNLEDYMDINESGCIDSSQNGW